MLFSPNSSSRPVGSFTSAKTDVVRIEFKIKQLEKRKQKKDFKKRSTLIVI